MIRGIIARLLLMLLQTALQRTCYASWSNLFHLYKVDLTQIDYGYINVQYDDINFANDYTQGL